MYYISAPKGPYNCQSVILPRFEKSYGIFAAKSSKDTIILGRSLEHPQSTLDREADSVLFIKGIVSSANKISFSHFVFTFGLKL